VQRSQSAILLYPVLKSVRHTNDELMTCREEIYAGQDIADSLGRSKVDGPNRRRQPASPRSCLAIQTNDSSSPTRGPLDSPILSLQFTGE
jgi:hypothetical protein